MKTIYIYIYIYIEREREREREIWISCTTTKDWHQLWISVCNNWYLITTDKLYNEQNVYVVGWEEEEVINGGSKAIDPRLFPDSPSNGHSFSLGFLLLIYILVFYVLEMQQYFQANLWLMAQALWFCISISTMFDSPLKHS